MNNNKAFLPIIGIVLTNEEVFAYDYKSAATNNFHHSFIIASKGISTADYDTALRFVKLPDENFYTLEGEPALDPFLSGKNQIIAFAAYCIENGVDPNMRVKIKDHKLGTLYEDTFIGRIQDFIEAKAV